MTNDQGRFRHKVQAANVKTILPGSEHFLQNCLRPPTSATVAGGRPQKCDGTLRGLAEASPQFFTSAEWSFVVGICHSRITNDQRRPSVGRHLPRKSAANALAFRNSPVANLVRSFQFNVLPGPKTRFFMNSPTSLLST